MIIDYAVGDEVVSLEDQLMEDGSSIIRVGDVHVVSCIAEVEGADDPCPNLCGEDLEVRLEGIAAPEDTFLCACAFRKVQKIDIADWFRANRRILADA